MSEKKWQHRWHSPEISSISQHEETTKWFDTILQDGYLQIAIKPGSTIEWREKPVEIKIGTVLKSLEDLVSAPNRTVIVDKDGDVWEKYPTLWFPTNINYEGAPNKDLFECYLPATVIHLPKEED